MMVRQSLARHLGITPGAALTLLEGSDRLDLPVDPDCGALLLRDLEHQPISLRLDPLVPGGVMGDTPM